MAAPKGGCFGKILDIDLTTGKISTVTYDDETARKYLGGAGLSTYYLYKEVPKGTDPLSPANILMLASGPLCGTECPGSRLTACFKSPISGGLGNSYIGGGFPSELKWAGWDMIKLRGKAPKLCYISIKDGNVEIRDAAAMAGKDTFETEEMIKAEIKDPDAKCLVIGPAGENLVPMACIISERFKAAGRLGGGCVMGSKNVKGIAVRGTGYVPLADKDGFHKVAGEASLLCAVNERAPGYRQFGTALSLDQSGWIDSCMCTNNYQTGYLADVGGIGGEESTRTFWQKHSACPGCPAHCMKLGVLRGTEEHDGLVVEGPEYESGTMLGTNIGLRTLEECMPLVELCDALGIDNIGTGNAIAYAMELSERGILKPEDLDGIKAEFGSVEAARALMEAIAYKKGKAGELLGKGTYAIAKKLGPEAEKYAVMCRRQGWAGWDPRGMRPRMFTYILGPRGGVHTDGTSTKGIADLLVVSSCCLCSFIPSSWKKRSNSMLWEMLNAECGWNMDEAEFNLLGKRLMTLQRAYSHREYGLSRKDDMPPPRMFEEMPDGPKKGTKWAPEEVKKIQDEFYAYYGWDDNGVPTEKCLKEYGLDFCADSLKA